MSTAMAYGEDEFARRLPMSEVIRYSASRLKFEGGEMTSSVTAPWIVVLAHDFDVEHNLRLVAERQGAAYKESRERLGLELGKATLRADHFEQQVGELREHSVTKIMLDVVPGEDGMGEEVYATSVADVNKHISQMCDQIEDLGEQLSGYENGFWGRMAAKAHIENRKLQAKLDTAMGLLRSYPGQTLGIYERAWVRERNAFLNTTSTEGKDHE